LTKRLALPRFPAILKTIVQESVLLVWQTNHLLRPPQLVENFMPDLELLFEWLRSGNIFVPIKATFRLEKFRRHIGYCQQFRAWALL